MVRFERRFHTASVDQRRSPSQLCLRVGAAAELNWRQSFEYRSEVGAPAAPLAIGPQRIQPQNERVREKS